MSDHEEDLELLGADEHVYEKVESVETSKKKCSCTLFFSPLWAVFVSVALTLQSVVLMGVFQDSSQ